MTSSKKIWLIIFTDMMSLLLTFFVLIYSMSEPKSSASGIKKETIYALSNTGLSRGAELQYLTKIIPQHVSYDYEIKDNSLRISIPYYENFEQEEKQNQIEKITLFLNNISNNVYVLHKSKNIEFSLLKGSHLANLLYRFGYVNTLPIMYQESDEEKLYIIIDSHSKERNL